VYEVFAKANAEIKEITETHAASEKRVVSVIDTATQSARWNRAGHRICEVRCVRRHQCYRSLRKLASKPPTPRSQCRCGLRGDRTGCPRLSLSQGFQGFRVEKAPLTAGHWFLLVAFVGAFISALARY
jgi:hypothetical protein